MCKTQIKLVKEYRNKTISGKIIDLTPFSPMDSERIVDIRNSENVRWGFNQTRVYDARGQIDWYERYIRTDNDIFWCIRKKDGTIVGMIRAYDIDHKIGECKQGTFAMDEEYANEAPYAVEALVLTLDFIFDRLGMKKVIHEDRDGNRNMNNLSKKLGMVQTGTIDFKGAKYNCYALQKNEYYERRNRFINLVDYWANR